MSEVENSLVHHGFWINWAQGPVMGQTITTDASAANIIIAIITVLTTTALAQLWNLLTFLYHQLRASGEPRDGLYWQQQAILRTLPTPTSFVADSVKLWWIWRRKAKHQFWRSMLPICFTLLFAVAAVACGIFSTYVVNTSNLEVLVESPYCGRANQSRTYSEPRVAASPYLAKIFPAMKSYARDCYVDQKNLPSRCYNTFVRPNISFTHDDVGCPWDDSMCLRQQSPAITMDSGLVDESYLGFNVKPENRVRFRKKTTCNVLPLDGHMTVQNANESASSFRRGFPEEKLVMLHYLYAKDSSSPWTIAFGASMLMINITKSYKTLGRVMSTAGSSVYAPLASMNRTDADVALNVIWLNDVRYSRTNDDPMFSAHVNKNSTISEGTSTPVYAADNPAGVFGCAIQYQFCIARRAKYELCTALDRLPSNISKEIWPDASDIQLVILQLMRDASLEMHVSTGAMYDYTQAGEQLQTGPLPYVPNDQWKTEVIGWEALAWAGIQVRLSDYALGPQVRDPNNDIFTEWPVTPAEKHMCGSMKMRKAGGFVNINVFGLAFVITFSAVISLINLTALRFFIFLSRFRRALAPRLDRWVQDGVLQLQRRAFDADGQGDWFGIDKEIPTTVRGQELHELPLDSCLHLRVGWKESPTDESTDEKKGYNE